MQNPCRQANRCSGQMATTVKQSHYVIKVLLLKSHSQSQCKLQFCEPAFNEMSHDDAIIT